MAETTKESTVSSQKPKAKGSDPEITSDQAVKALIPLLITFILGTLCLQGFNLVFTQVGKDVGAPAQASLITALPSIVLGIVCFVYGSLGDFVSLKKLVVVGITLLITGSIFGFVANFWFKANIWTVIIARVIQTAGEQVAGSVYLVVATKYLKDSLKVIFFGIFTAGYQVSAAIGVFAAGFLTSIHWQYLFLIPVVTVLFLPLLLHNLPNKSSTGEKVDVWGFVLFGTATAFLTLFFSYMMWWMLLVSAALYAVFAVYIHKAKNPFITPDFFHNTRWIMAISLILLFYLPNYSFSPIFNAIGSEIYHMGTDTISLYIVWAFVVAAIFGTCSGWIIGKIGKTRGIILAGCAQLIGLVVASFCVNVSPVALALAGCIYYAGIGMMYSPIVDSVLGTLTKDESGRGVGMNDLAMNVAGSIGIAIIGGLMSSKPMTGFSLAGLKGSAANYSNLFLVAAIATIAGLVVFFICHKKIYAQK
ncbi:MFS transporter [Bifidobacterium sp. ESL0784]|uniref:MFS transporter n=1 Tax=Bifidobacterium sp. ESL0784 TaxID=2983231 RepID=UPI0023FA3CA4|nr:MFS transporter [Bifidobacterium sp. ESL0784]MDF7640226.1 MFS transporter [Bifidobacterium sp. ESL0784]